jgi:hypothetical protein
VAVEGDAGSVEAHRGSGVGVGGGLVEIRSGATTPM